VPQVRANGINIEYRILGPGGGVPVLFVGGCGAQLTTSEEFVAELCKRGYRVIVYDNRDIGLSARFDAAGVPDWAQIQVAMLAAQPISVAYTLSDMAADAAGLLEALGVERAHIMGGSMGGMIAQLVAADHPRHTATLTVLSSTSGNPGLPMGSVFDASSLVAPPADEPVESVVERNLAFFKLIMSPAYPTEDSVVRARLLRDLQRCHYPAGISRQMAASVVNQDRRAKLRTIHVPTLVVHGEADPVLPIEAGRDIAANIPGATFRAIPGMGHDLPAALIPLIADEFEALAARVAATR
jgi:pimeloyl-ACP methyl ester carboxylesterase